MTSQLLKSVSLALLLLTPVVGQTVESRQKETNCRPERWKEAMAKFEKADEANPPQPGGVVFVGSSSIRLWKLEKSFPKQKDLVNRGFGGSEICDAVHYFDLLVARHQPRLVVLYAGDNDVAGGKKAQQVLADFRAFAEQMKIKLPQTQLVYISIKPSIARWKLAEEMKKANTLIAKECEKQPKQLVFLNVWNTMLSKEGKPRKELFIKDGLHLNEKGYERWTALLRPHLAPAKQ